MAPLYTTASAAVGPFDPSGTTAQAAIQPQSPCRPPKSPTPKSNKTTNAAAGLIICVTTRRRSALYAIIDAACLPPFVALRKK